MSIKNTQEKFTLAPASQPQEEFLASDSTITLYHGSAGGGKTFAIILNMVKFAAMRNSTIVCFRRTSTQIRAPGSVWQEATVIFQRMFPDAKIKHRDLEIYIPSTNSLVKFSHLQYVQDVNSFLGSQLSAVFFDEATTFEPFEDFILPLLGRMRNANVDYKPQMFWATNPKFEHGIHHWIRDFYLDDNGIAIPERSNVERYFVLQDNKPLWYDSMEEAEAIHGKGKPRSFRAIRSHVTQNIPLMRSNPDYVSNLLALPDIKRRIFYDGSWTAREEEAGYFKREWCNIVPFASLERCQRVRAWDSAAVAPSSASPDPDWTRGTLISKDKNGIYTVEDIVSLRDRPHVVEQAIYATAEEDGSGVTVVIECDPGQAGIAYANHIKTKLAEMGYYCKVIRSQKAKLTRFLPVSALAEAGKIQFVRGEWLEDAFIELEEFTGSKHGGHDDICDTLSSGIAALNQGVSLPTMSIPNLSAQNQPTQSFYNAYHNNASTFTMPTFNIKNL